jgi:hypothetical protein
LTDIASEDDDDDDDDDDDNETDGDDDSEDKSGDNDSGNATDDNNDDDDNEDEDEFEEDEDDEENGLCGWDPIGDVSWGFSPELSRILFNEAMERKRINDLMKKWPQICQQPKPTHVAPVPTHKHSSVVPRPLAVSMAHVPISGPSSAAVVTSTNYRSSNKYFPAASSKQPAIFSSVKINPPLPSPAPPSKPLLPQNSITRPQTNIVPPIPTAVSRSAPITTPVLNQSYTTKSPACIFPPIPQISSTQTNVNFSPPAPTLVSNSLLPFPQNQPHSNDTSPTTSYAQNSSPAISALPQTFNRSSHVRCIQPISTGIPSNVSAESQPNISNMQQYVNSSRPTTMPTNDALANYNPTTNTKAIPNIAALDVQQTIAQLNELSEQLRARIHQRSLISGSAASHNNNTASVNVSQPPGISTEGSNRTVPATLVTHAPHPIPHMQAPGKLTDIETLKRWMLLALGRLDMTYVSMPFFSSRQYYITQLQ